MPCTSSCSSEPRYPFEQMLCAVLTALTKVPQTARRLLDKVDWEEAGVPRATFELWWAQHERDDAARRRREAEDRMAEAERKAALAKLTPAERKALGLYGGR